MERCTRKQRAECNLPNRICGLHEHHILYPESTYKALGAVAVQYRELPCFRVKMCKNQEIKLHDESPEGPPPPTPEFMQYMVDVYQLRRELER